MPRHCVVTTVGKDGQLHSIETDTDSLFAAAHAGIRSWSLLWWYDSDAVIEVRSAEGTWKVSAARVSTWYRDEFGNEEFVSNENDGSGDVAGVRHTLHLASLKASLS